MKCDHLGCLVDGPFHIGIHRSMYAIVLVQEDREDAGEVELYRGVGFFDAFFIVN